MKMRGEIKVEKRDRGRKEETEMGKRERE